MEKTGKVQSGLLVYLKEHGRLFLLCGGLLLGIALIALGGSLMGDDPQATSTTGDMGLAELQSYEIALEKELAALCEAVAGVGQAEVMVHLERGTHTLFATDGDGKTVTVGTGSAQNALQSALLSPKVAGVGVVCRGGNDPAVQQRLTELISTTLDIPSNRVFITGK